MNNELKAISFVSETAGIMADYYEEGLGTPYNPDEFDSVLYERLSATFDKVLPELRAAVFIGFLSELDRRKLPYNVEKFK